MSTVTLVLGLPGSPAESHARQLAAVPGGRAVLLAWRDLHRTLSGGAGAGGEAVEQLTTLVEREALQAAIRAGLDVVVHSPRLLHYPWLSGLRAVAGRAGAQVRLVDHTDTDLDVCIAQDRLSPYPVGEQEIRRLHQLLTRQRALRAEHRGGAQ